MEESDCWMLPWNGKMLGSIYFTMKDMKVMKGYRTKLFKPFFRFSTLKLIRKPYFINDSKENQRLALKPWLKTGLFAEFVGCNSIENAVSFDRDCFLITCVYRMICSLTQKEKTMLLKVSHQITPLDRHPVPQLELAQSKRHPAVIPFVVQYMPRPFH